MGISNSKDNQETSLYKKIKKTSKSDLNLNSISKNSLFLDNHDPLKDSTLSINEKTLLKIPKSLKRERERNTCELLNKKAKSLNKTEPSFLRKDNQEISTDFGSFKSALTPSLICFTQKELKSKNKNQERIRRGYLNKLIKCNCWNPDSKCSKFNSIIIFDWDDTLLPTSYLSPKGNYLEEIFLNDFEKRQLKTIEDNAMKLINLAKSKAKVFIITNACTGWVEFTSKIFYPRLKNALEGVKIISARGKYEKCYPNDTKKWKIKTFLDIRHIFPVEYITNIVTLGDSDFEICAAKILAEKFMFSVCKTIKFKKEPKPSDIAKQLELCICKFEKIYYGMENMSVNIEKKCC